jgi:hypothetical protein
MSRSFAELDADQEAIARLRQACDLSKVAVPVYPSDLMRVLDRLRYDSSRASKGRELAAAVESFDAGECSRKRIVELAVEVLKS